MAAAAGPATMPGKHKELACDFVVLKLVELELAFAGVERGAKGWIDDETRVVEEARDWARANEIANLRDLIADPEDRVARTTRKHLAVLSARASALFE
jgi:hypothetical protein